jgi:hypothetical protein
MGITWPLYHDPTTASQVVPAPSNRPEDIKKPARIENKERKPMYHLFCGRYQELFFLNLIEVKESNKIFVKTRREGIGSSAQASRG